MRGNEDTYLRVMAVPTFSIPMRGNEGMVQTIARRKHVVFDPHEG